MSDIVTGPVDLSPVLESWSVPAGSMTNDRNAELKHLLQSPLVVQAVGFMTRDLSQMGFLTLAGDSFDLTAEELQAATMFLSGVLFCTAARDLEANPMDALRSLGEVIKMPQLLAV